MATDQATKLLARLDELGVPSELVEEIDAPQVRTFMVRPTSAKTRMMDYRRLNRADDLAYALCSSSVKITAPVPGRGVVAIEVSREDRQTVALDDLPDAWPDIGCWIGVDTENRPVALPIYDMPHALVSGTTGSGKTTCLHTILAQLLSVCPPSKLQLVLLDPKRVELTQWEDAPHLAAPVADMPEEAVRQLRGAVLTMERRYAVLQNLGVRDIDEANEKLRFEGHQEIPRALIVADEIADLMMASNKEAESLIVRLAQKGRAAGIHLILATQYPNKETITGTLRANIPTKIAFQVTDAVASRVALGANGAELLLGSGDGLLSLGGLPPIRFQSARCSPAEIKEIVRRW